MGGPHVEVGQVQGMESAASEALNPCTCEQCSPVRVYHWFCSHCGRGPFVFLDTKPAGSVQYRKQGQETPSILHACCRGCYDALDTRRIKSALDADLKWRGVGKVAANRQREAVQSAGPADADDSL